MPDQLPLKYNDAYRFSAVWTDILAELEVIVATVGLKQVAFDLDEQPSAVANAIAERDRHSIKARWLPYLISKAPSDRIVEMLAQLRGLAVAPRRELSPAEKLERLMDVLQRNPALAKTVLQEAGL